MAARMIVRFLSVRAEIAALEKIWFGRKRCRSLVEAGLNERSLRRAYRGRS